jgi:hypothetical protein
MAKKALTEKALTEKEIIDNVAHILKNGSQTEGFEYQKELNLQPQKNLINQVCLHLEPMFRKIFKQALASERKAFNQDVINKAFNQVVINQLDGDKSFTSENIRKRVLSAVDRVIILVKNGEISMVGQAKDGIKKVNVFVVKTILLWIMLNEDTKKAWEDMLYFTKWLSESH